MKAFSLLPKILTSLALTAVPATLALALAVDSTAERTTTSPADAALSVVTELDHALDDLLALDTSLTPDEVLDLLDELVANTADKSLVEGGANATGFTPHRRWRRGNVPHGFGIDQFNQPDAGVYRARAAIRLFNGDVLVVGDSTNLSNITHAAMVRYDRHGRRVAWSSVQDEFSLAGGQAVRFPGTSPWGDTRSIHAVHDVAARGSDIYVLATQFHNNQRRPIILRFSTAGDGALDNSGAEDLITGK